MGTFAEALARYEDEHQFARQILLPEEDRVAFTSMPWQGGYRWFRSPNVVALEKIHRLKSQGRIPGGAEDSA
jgi:hypothetical protein